MERVRSLKNDILTMRHEELESLSPEYTNELKDLARVILSIFG
jgi:hypothetical protein